MATTKQTEQTRKLREALARKNTTIYTLQQRLVALRAATAPSDADDATRSLVEMYPELVAELDERPIRTRRTARQLANLTREAETRNLRDLGRFVAGKYRETYGRDPPTKFLTDLGYEVKAYEDPDVIKDWVLRHVA